jgi:TM2 domain-containing membrane protein YozV
MDLRTLTAVLFAFLVPGAGHFYLGRRARAVAFFGIVLFLFLVGLAVDGKLYTMEPGKPLTFLATIASMGLGLPYFIARAAGPFGDVMSITYEYGTAFALTAGLMNMLLILDSFDIARQRKA